MDNGKEFTDRLFGLRKRAQSGKHEFDKLCAELDIEPRLTPPDPAKITPDKRHGRAVLRAH